mgnify:CR=1 FL=1
MNATVFVQGDQVEVWAPVQGPDGLVNDLATYLGVKRQNIKVNVTFMGGAFGRKAVFDFVMQAANLSKQVILMLLFLAGAYRSILINIIFGIHLNKNLANLILLDTAIKKLINYLKKVELN